MTIRVESEIGRLRRVLIHRPGREIDWMVPSMMGNLLFDDILDGDEARLEHDLFCQVLRQGGVEVLDAQDLLGEVLASEGTRGKLLDELQHEYGAPAEVVRGLRDVEPKRLAATLVEGIRSAPEATDAARRQFFDFNPLPNYFFQRDPLVVLGDRLIVSAMATDAREREPLLAHAMFGNHPALAGFAALFEIDVPPTSAPLHNPGFPYATLEGGDVIVVSKEILLVGSSERTNRQGVEALAEYLRREETSFRYLIQVEMPRARSYMHLDTVFTLIDHNSCLAFLPVIAPGGPESARVYTVDLQAPALTFKLRSALLPALAELGLPLEAVPCGGPSEPIDQQREQWTDGTNAFAIAPGVILLYHRNRKTIEELAGRGWRVLPQDEVVAGQHDLLNGEKAVVTLLSNELSRARGGPRCMTMPLERDTL